MKKAWTVVVLLAAGLSCDRVIAAETDDEDDAASVMVDAANGWRVQARSHGDTQLGYAVERTTDGGKHWQDVSPAALRRANKSVERPYADLGSPALSALDARRAWVEVSTTSENLLLEYTDGGGKHWREKRARIKGSSAFVSFVDQAHGFLLAMGEPAAGRMHKAVYSTSDGGTRWRDLDGAPAGQYYPTGIVFRTRGQGWITGTNHGEPDVPFFRTTDGGHTWEVQTLPYPAGIGKVLGGNPSPPVFTGPGKKRGRLTVNLSWTDARKAEGQDQGDFFYQSEDGGATWHLSAPGAHPAQED